MSMNFDTLASSETAVSFRPSILIVEDDALVAMEMEARVSALGYTVIGPAPTVASARRLLDTETPDAALLDVNVRGERVTPIAERLREDGVPYALVTGYARLHFSDPALETAPKLGKPVNERDLMSMLRSLLEHN